MVLCRVAAAVVICTLLAGCPGFQKGPGGPGDGPGGGAEGGTEADGGLGPIRDGGGGDGGGGGGDRGLDQSSPGAPDAPGAVPDAACPPGRHWCTTGCVDDRSPMSCGMSCEACPMIEGGTATCDGRQCGGSCVAPLKLCNGECVPEAQPCGACPSGTHNCNNVCASNTSVGSCGPMSCTACRTPVGGMATCNGMTCDFTCTTGKKCGDACVTGCCTSADCAAMAGKSVVCDQATRACQYTCNSGTKDCNGTCIPMAGCCGNADCPMMNGMVGSCDSSTRMCAYSCTATQKACGGRCIDRAACCADSDCTNNFACVSNACSTSSCRMGYKLCGATCVPDSTCCTSGTVGCPACKTCSGGTCTNVADGPGCGAGMLCSSGSCVTCQSLGRRLCGTTCVDGNCCGDGDCNGFACVNNRCSTSDCRSGWRKCGTTCVDGNCCNDGDCGACRVCSANRCGNAGAGTPCGSASSTCVGTTLDRPDTCSAGVCQENRSSCAAGMTCGGGTCKKADGQTCATDGECASNSCHGPKFCVGGSNANCPCEQDFICESGNCREERKTCGGRSCPTTYVCNSSPPSIKTCDVQCPGNGGECICQGQNYTGECREL